MDEWLFEFILFIIAMIASFIAGVKCGKRD